MFSAGKNGVIYAWNVSNISNPLVSSKILFREEITSMALYNFNILCITDHHGIELKFIDVETGKVLEQKILYGKSVSFTKEADLISLGKLMPTAKVIRLWKV